MENIFIDLKKSIKIISIIFCIFFFGFVVGFITLFIINFNKLKNDLYDEKIVLFLLILLFVCTFLSFQPFIFGIIFLKKNKNINEINKVKNLSLLEFGIFYSRIINKISSAFNNSKLEQNQEINN